MTHEEKLLQIELERLEMEKRRDKNASTRFVIGTILLALGSTGMSFYLDEQREKRALAASERQWVVPMVIETQNHKHEFRLKRLQSLVDLQLTSNTTTYLLGEIKAAETEFKILTANNKALELAKTKAEKLAKVAVEAKQGATVLAMQSQKLNPDQVVDYGSAMSSLSADIGSALTMAPEVAEKQYDLAKEKSLKAAEAAQQAQNVVDKLTSESVTLEEKLNQSRLLRLKSY